MRLIEELKPLLLQKPPLTLAVAESVTCGRIQALVGSVSGASDFFLGGVTAYRLEQKVRHLGVDRDSAAKTNCVSAAVAEEMAQGACRLFGSDVGLATTGYAEPSPANGVERPFAWWGLARKDAAGGFLISTGKVVAPAGASRTDVQEVVAREALVALLRHLRELRGAAGPVL